MNKPINIEDLRSIKITPSSERALDGTRVSDLSALMMKMEEDYLFDVSILDIAMPIGWYCDISKAGLDKWEQEANERVMSNIDKLIDLENSRGYVIPIKCFCEGDIADANFLLVNGIKQVDFSVIKPDDDNPYTHTIVVLSYGRTFKVAIPFLTMKLIYFSLPTGANNS